MLAVLPCHADPRLTKPLCEDATCSKSLARGCPLAQPGFRSMLASCMRDGCCQGSGPFGFGVRFSLTCQQSQGPPGCSCHLHPLGRGCRLPQPECLHSHESTSSPQPWLLSPHTRAHRAQDPVQQAANGQQRLWVDTMQALCCEPVLWIGNCPKNLKTVKTNQTTALMPASAHKADAADLAGLMPLTS